MGKNNNGANPGFEADLWRTADALRSKKDTAEYNPRSHVSEGKGEIRKAIIEAYQLDCMVALSVQLAYWTQILVWS